jgi:hypothetical protein
VQRQYFVKIQRGKIDAEKLLFLRSLYQSAVTKTLYVKVIQLKDMRADSLEVIISKQREIEKKFSSKKRQQKKSKNFLHSCRRDFNNYSRSGLTRS